MIKQLTITVALCLTGLGAAQADQLADIRARGTLICATIGTIEPFSFQDPKTRETVGYEVDQCRALARELGVKLEIKNVAVEARIPELTQGRVDILAAAMGYTEERSKQIDYSNTSFVSRQMLMTKSSSGITSIAELKEKKISAPKGSSSEKYVRELLPKANLLTFQDPSSAFLALQQSKVDALILSELALMKFKQQVGAGLDVIKEPVAMEFWGLTVRKGEPAFLEFVNNTLNKLESSGEAATIFNKWIGADSPYKLERTFNLNQPVGNPVMAKVT